MGVLVVEDEPIIAIDMKYSLADLGVRQVHVAPSLSAGYTIFRSKPLDLAILDVNIGTDLVFPLAAGMVSKKIPIVFSTGRAPGEFPAEWTAHPIIQKPWDERIPSVTAALRGKSEHRKS
ncbi:response regulator [Pseudorhodoplanes sp.]|uniref:response regulator n=1 Tax=Pseudorhodoplanes sp. TaxID=1934341 RepID=UPI003D0DCFBE